MKQIFRKKWPIVILVSIMIGTVGFISVNDREFKIAKNLDIFYTLFRELNLYYVDETNPEELINSSIEGMLKSLDPYTSYIPESEMEDFKFQTTGEYGGIGALIRKAGDYTIVAEPYEGFPAHKAGLIAGDTIISIDGISIKGKAVSDVSELLKGTPQTELKLKIKRYGEKDTLEKIFKREKITISNVRYSDMLDNNIGYIRLSSFTEDAGVEVKKALLKLKEKGAKKIILDLRNNPGGLLKESVEVANIFIQKGQEVVSTKGRVKQWDHRYESAKSAIDTIIPLVVLVNRASASASEIVAGALQDLDRAVIVGQRTYGKGLVQTTRPLSYNSQLKVTTAKYYIPSGRCIQAIDYSHKNEDGSVGYIPDSLISEFTTKNGRKVYDGGGINPDIEVEIERPGNITLALFAKNVFFNYATIYAAEHDSIPPAHEFEISDDDFQQFKDYVKGIEFDYTTVSSEKFEELIKTAKQEKYYNINKNLFDSLKVKLSHNLEKDIENFKKEIKQLLVQEIAGRYYLQMGQAITSLRDDPQLDKAVEVINDMDRYLSILSIQNIDNLKIAKSD